jgi:predicted ATPase/transcriptional regulator with XRE-family HTH domain
MDLASPTRFGDLLRRYRLVAGLTQEELAESAHLSPRAISDLERGQRNRPWRDTIQLLADALDLGAPERARLEIAARRQTLAEPTETSRGDSGPSAQSGPTRSTLPTLLTPLVGREGAIVAVRDLLRRADVRLVTLTGSGGIGKTSLALATAAKLIPEFPDGVAFVPLEGLADHRLVAPAIAKVLDLRGDEAQLPWETLRDFLRDRRCLLVLDNFEQLLGAATDVGAMLAACPRLALLVTSRSPLHLTGEREFLLAPLDTPAAGPERSLAGARQSAAVQLFVGRSQAVRPDFELSLANLAAVTEVCRRLEGIPLALELAAATVKALSVEQIARRLDDVFGHLSGVVRAGPPRQQTLRATLDWSFNLLRESERLLFRRLAVFASGFGLEAAEMVCVGERIGRAEILGFLVTLVDQSLVVATERDGETRYRLLEPVRQYASDLLIAAGEDERLRERHGEWCLTLAKQAEAEWLGGKQAYWIDVPEEERDNFRAALGWGLQNASSLAVQIIGRLWFFLYLFTGAAEGRLWLNAAAETHTDDRESRAKAMLGLGFILREAPEMRGAARSLTDESLGIFENIGDRRYAGWALHNLGNISMMEDHYDDARPALEASVAAFRAVGDAAGAGTSLRDLGHAWECDGDLDRASACYEESIALLRDQGDHWSVGWTLHNTGGLCLGREEIGRASAHFEEALTDFRLVRHQAGIASVNVELARLDHRHGNDHQARSRLAEAINAARNHGVQARLWRGVSVVGIIAVDEGAPMIGLRLIGAAVARVPLADNRPADRAELEASLAAARSALGDAEYARVWAEGQKLTLEQAFEQALNEVGA